MKSEERGWPLKEVWKDYEEIAMHFNDLLIKLRTQALGGVAALSALVGIFGKTETEATDADLSLTCFFEIQNRPNSAENR
jgi:hypothetical protein